MRISVCVCMYVTICVYVLYAREKIWNGTIYERVDEIRIEHTQKIPLFTFGLVESILYGPQPRFHNRLAFDSQDSLGFGVVFETDISHVPVCVLLETSESTKKYIILVYCISIGKAMTGLVIYLPPLIRR